MKTALRVLAFSFVALALICATPAVAANFNYVTDGSFEFGCTGTNYCYYNWPVNSGTYMNANAWQWWGVTYPYNNSGGSAWGPGVAQNGSPWNFAPAPDGSWVAYLQDYATISQNIAGLTAGQTYYLSFFAAQRPGYGVNPMTVTIDGLTEVIIPTSTQWTKYTFSFVASGNDVLTFSTSTGVPGYSDYDIGLDDVGIYAPEPMTLMLFGTGLMGIGGLVRRKLRA